MSSDLVIHTTDQNFEKEVVQSDKPVLVDFWAPWCGPCRAIAPVLDELASEYGEKIKIVKVNVDENQQAPQRFSVRGIPTLIFFKGGKDVETLVGAHPKETLKEKIDSVLAN